MSVRQYTQEEKLQVLMRIRAGESVSSLSRVLDIPRTTLMGWKSKEEKSVEKGVEKGVGNVAPKARARAKKNTRSRVKRSTERQGCEKKEETNPKKEELVERISQSQRKETFSDSSWENIEKAHKIIDRRLSRALDYEKEIDRIIDEVAAMGDKDLSYQERNALMYKLKALRVTDLRDIVVLIGTLYDKQALANGEVNGKLGIEQEKPFEIVVTVKQ